MTTRNYSSRSQQTTLTSAVTAGASTIVVQSGTALLGGQSIPAGTTFTIVVDPDTAIEEILDATAVSTNTFTVTRGIDGSSGQAHSAGAVVRHMAIGRDYREANTHIEASTGVHGISNFSAVVGTTDTQTLTNKTLTSPTITNPNISGAGVDASIVFEGATPDDFETTLTVVDPTQDNTITLPNTTGTVVIATATQTLTNKTLTSPIISGSPVITGLSSAGMTTSSATPKDYVDSILGSATAASTSAASAAASATAAATSATSAAASATAAAASATTSASSATAAATSATSAAASATAAATSATSAAASAVTAAASVATIAGFATAAATSATSAATSASSAATSASSALTSANSAATSASTMNASVTAAATSAASAATSAASAASSATAAASSATDASTFQGLASGYAADAALSATDASGFASAASTSATSASNSATAAATSEANALTYSTAAASSATSAADNATDAATSASSALTSANSAATSYDEFDDRYLGAKSSPPTLDNDGNALLTGALYWNTGVNKMYVWSGTAWAEISSSADIIAYKYTVAGGATSVSGADDNGLTLSYTVGKEQVYINGVLQVRGSDYTASTGSSITGISAMLASDIVTVLAFTSFVVADTYTQAQADAKFFQNANAFVAGKNKIINGDFGIWQRGTSLTMPAAVWTYNCDRFSAYQNFSSGALVISRQTFTPGTAPVAGYEGNFFLRATAPTTGTTELNFRQLIENVTTFAGQTVTFSFWAKASGTTVSTIKLTQDFGSGGSARVDSALTTVTLTTSWARYSMTVTLASIAGKTIGTGSSLDAYFFTNSSFTGGATIDFWGWQVEAGSIATPFQTATGTIQGELAACQRYYWRTSNTGYGHYSLGYAELATQLNISFSFPSTMRTVPSVSSSAAGTLAAYRQGAFIATTSVMTYNQGSTNTLLAYATTAAASLTQFSPYVLFSNNTSSYVEFSAEL